MPFLHSEMSSVPPPKAFWPLMSLGIVLASQAATVLSLGLLKGYSPRGSINFLTSLAALLAGLPIWWHFIVKPRRATMLRGIFVGMLGSIIAHPLMWLLLSRPFPLSSWPQEIFFTLPIALLSSVLLSLYSLILVGWITTSMGAVAGGLLIYLQRAMTHHWQQRDRFPRDEAFPQERMSEHTEGNE